MNHIPYLLLSLLLAGVTLRAIWRSDLLLGIAAACCLWLFYLPVPTWLHPLLVVAWVVAVCPWRAVTASR